jgi:hypothetical protein
MLHVVPIALASGLAAAYGQSVSPNEIDVIVSQQRASFLQGEPISIGVELRNLSALGILEPRIEDWSVEVTDETGVRLEDLAPLPVPRFWEVLQEGGVPDFSIIGPSASKVYEFRLQNRFLIQAEGSYTVVFSVPVAPVVANESFPFGEFIVVESPPFEFGIDQSMILWEEAVGPLTFNVVDDGGELTVRFYRGPASIPDDPLFSDYTVVGEVDRPPPPPELHVSSTVTDREGRVGVRFVGPGGTMCAVVEIENDLVHFTPAVVIGSGESCPPP